MPPLRRRSQRRSGRRTPRPSRKWRDTLAAVRRRLGATRMKLERRKNVPHELIRNWEPGAQLNRGNACPVAGARQGPRQPCSACWTEQAAAMPTGALFSTLRRAPPVPSCAPPPCDPIFDRDSFLVADEPMRCATSISPRLYMPFPAAVHFPQTPGAVPKLHDGSCSVRSSSDGLRKSSPLRCGRLCWFRAAMHARKATLSFMPGWTKCLRTVHIVLGPSASSPRMAHPSRQPAGPVGSTVRSLAE